MRKTSLRKFITLSTTVVLTAGLTTVSTAPVFADDNAFIRVEDVVPGDEISAEAYDAAAEDSAAAAPSEIVSAAETPAADTAAETPASYGSDSAQIVDAAPADAKGAVSQNTEDVNAASSQGVSTVSEDPEAGQAVSEDPEAAQNQADPAADESVEETDDPEEEIAAEEEELADDEPEESEPVESVPMYRLFNSLNGEHFYTKAVKERDYLASAGWLQEGIGWFAPVTSSHPVYRLYNAAVNDHLYTTNAKERDYLVANGWTYEQIGWYSSDAEEVPLYRQYNPKALTGSHNYTTYTEENDNLVANGWNAEGIGWYGSPAKADYLEIIDRGSYDMVFRISSPESSSITFKVYSLVAGTSDVQVLNASNNGKGSWTAVFNPGLLDQPKLFEVEVYDGSGQKITSQDVHTAYKPMPNASTIIASARRTPTPGPYLCSEWIMDVFENAGYRKVARGDDVDADDFFYRYCKTPVSEIKPGMIIAVPTHNQSYMGSIYGHIGLYVGDGKVMQNIGKIDTMTLDAWCRKYGQKVTPKCGWYMNQPLR
ncbi:MAG: hypothetical protein U0L49_10085 [Eubacterium sp.]|nr:hypothetical protein [Eubacterium sp.]